MITHPTAAELGEALAGIETGPPGDFLDVPPDASDRKRKTSGLDREAARGPAAEAAATDRLRALLDMEGAFEALNAELCARLREGRLSPLDPAVLAHLKASVIDQIAIDQPGYSGLAALGG